MRRHDAARLDEFDGLECLVGAHRKPIADRQHGQVDSGRADLAHVEKQPRVAGEIDLAVLEREQEAARVASAGAVGQE